MNKFSKNKRIAFAIIYFCLVTAVICVLSIVQFRQYNANYNEYINRVYCLIEKNYPEVEREDLVRMLDTKGADADTFDYLATYGIDIEKDSALIKNDNNFKWFILLDVGVGALLLAGLYIVVNYVFRTWDNALDNIAKELVGINRGDYSFDLDSESEGKMAILENELYKTAIICRENAENAHKDKLNLKESLSDISHQIKTPLTSLLINLDNLDEFKDMPENKRQQLIDNSRRDANKINQLIQQLLKLSRLDADAIEFEKKKTRVEDLLLDSAENVLALCDLKGVELIYKGKVLNSAAIARLKSEAADKLQAEEENCSDDHDGSREVSYETATLFCDPYWEVEAISNIMKNGVEHALSKVEVAFEKYELYTDIIIENDGEQISCEDANKIFTRYYRGELAAADSVGIGLSLADGIVKRDDGYIIAEGYEKITGHGEEQGTRFVLRFFTKK